MEFRDGSYFQAGCRGFESLDETGVYIEVGKQRVPRQNISERFSTQGSVGQVHRKDNC